jgi:hypothetical protein
MMAHLGRALTTDGMTHAKTSVPSTGANPEQGRTSADTAISDKLPSSDVNAPVALALGEVVKGRLADSSQNGKCHYWSVELPAGKYKFVLDVKRSDDPDSNIGGTIMLTSDGQEEEIGHMSEIDRRHRGVYRIEVSAPLKGILRYSNNYTISDYQLGVFEENALIAWPFFIKNPPVLSFKLGEVVQTPILEGESTWMREACYSITLPAGDHNVSVEYRRVDKNSSNVGGIVAILGEDGEDKERSLIDVNAIGSSARRAVKLFLADTASLVFRVRARWAQETAVLNVQEVKE